jgi:hypothetical protein
MSRKKKKKQHVLHGVAPGEKKAFVNERLYKADPDEVIVIHKKLKIK